MSSGLIVPPPRRSQQPQPVQPVGRQQAERQDPSATQRNLGTAVGVHAGLSQFANTGSLWGGMAKSYYNVPGLVLTQASPARFANQMRADREFVQHGRQMEQAQGLPTLKRSSMELVEPADAFRALVLLKISHMVGCELSGNVNLTGTQAKISSPLGSANVQIQYPDLDLDVPAQMLLERIFVKSSAEEPSHPRVLDLRLERDRANRARRQDLEAHRLGIELPAPPRRDLPTMSYGGWDGDIHRAESPVRMPRPGERGRPEAPLPAKPARSIDDIEKWLDDVLPEGPAETKSPQVPFGFVDPELNVRVRRRKDLGLGPAPARVVEEVTPEAKSFARKAGDLGGSMFNAAKGPLKQLGALLAIGAVAAPAVAGANALTRHVAKGFNRRQEESRFENMINSIDLSPQEETRGRSVSLTGQLARDFETDPNMVRERLRPGFSMLNTYAPTVAKDPNLALEFAARLARNQTAHITPEEYLSTVQELMRLENEIQTVQPGLGDRVPRMFMPDL